MMPKHLYGVKLRSLNSFELALCIILLGMGTAHAQGVSRRSAPSNLHSDLASFAQKAVGSVPSAYGGWIRKVISQWPALNRPFKLPGDLNLRSSIELQCLLNEKNYHFIGVAQRMWIEAPLKGVQKWIDDVDRYQQIFPGYKNIHLTLKEPAHWITFWEQIVPVFFISNVKYEMHYWLYPETVTADTHLRIYLYGLKSSKTLKSSDGVIVLESVDAQHTLYTEYDFFDADWGLAASFGGDKVWKESVEGVALSDLAFKVAAEHPTFSSAQIQERSKEILGKDLVKNCTEHKNPFDPEK